MDNKPIARKELKEVLSISQSWCDILIKRCANGEKIKLFEINNINVIDIDNGQQTIEMGAQNVNLCENKVEYIKGESPLVEVLGILQQLVRL